MVMEEFSKFLKDSEGNEDMKSALDSVVNELLTKEKEVKQLHL